MTGKYTPGPWRKRGVNKIVCGPEGNTVADVRYKNGDADARLIAAAPDLLEALRKITLAVAMQDKDQLYPDTREGWMMAADDIEAIARAAIDKAEGRE